MVPRNDLIRPFRNLKGRFFLLWQQTFPRKEPYTYLKENRKGEPMKEQLEKIKEEALQQISSAESLDTLNDIRVA